MNSLPTFRFIVLAALIVPGFRDACFADQKYRIQFKFLPESQLRYLSSQTVTQTAAVAAVEVEAYARQEPVEAGSPISVSVPRKV